MLVRRYLGANTQEAMSKLKKELGSDAVILNTRTVKPKGILGIFKKPLIEIVAAIDEKENEKEYDANIKNINTEISKLRGIVEKVAFESNSGKEKIDDKLERYNHILVNNGVEPDIARSILYKIQEQTNVNEKDDATIKKIVRYNIIEYLGNVEPIKFTSNQKIIFFVGPTGVGKTTTLAKIAAQLVLEEKYKIGLITADTYRIGAVEQLRTYSEILNMPLKVIYKSDEIYKALAEYKDKDFILIDTAGRSHKDIKQLNEIKNLVNSVNNKEVYLVLSLNTELKTLNSIINQYKFIDNFKIIFTKLDESDILGNILNIKFYNDNQLSYFTLGQDVPDDIEIANIEKIASLLIEEN